MLKRVVVFAVLLMVAFFAIAEPPRVAPVEAKHVPASFSRRGDRV